MTLLRFLHVTTYRHYLEQFMDSVIPLQRKSAIEMIADFRNPMTVNEVDFINIQEI